MEKLKILKKAYRVWVYSHIGEYPIFRVEDVEVVYSDSVSEAKHQCDLYDAKNEDGDTAQWIDIKCVRVKEYDNVEYEGITTSRRYVISDMEEKKRIEKRKKCLSKLPENELFYVQDSRNYVGNSILWWGLNNNGYVCDIRKAHKYTKGEILKRFSAGRDSDVIWSAKHVEDNISQHIDSQNLKSEFCY